MDLREAYVEKCKARAREYLAHGDIQNAVASMLSDMSQHPDTKPAHVLAMLGVRVVLDNDLREAERFIEGFN